MRFPANVNALRSFCLLPLLFACACGTTSRFGQDVLVTLTSPGVVLYNAAVDSAATSSEAGQSTDSGFVHAVTLPLAFAWHAIEHTVYCGAHAVDACFCPFYGIAEIGPTQMPVAPLDIYDGLVLDRDKWNDLADAESTTGG